jgi:uncharacterized protein with FMN-binding domain
VVNPVQYGARGRRYALTLLMILAVAAAASAGGRKELVEVRRLEILDIDISAIPDGVYQGEFTYGSSVQIVVVHVEEGVITEIEVIQGSETVHGLAGCTWYHGVRSRRIVR